MADDTTIDVRSTEEVVRDFLDRIEKNDLDGALELCADDIEVTWLPVGTFHGKREFRKELEELLHAFPDYTQTIDRILVDGDTATVQFTNIGTFSGGEFAGLQPTGEKGTVHGCHIIDLEDGIAVRSMTYWDGMQMAREIGILPEEGSVGDRAMNSLINLATRAKRRLRR